MDIQSAREKVQEVAQDNSSMDTSTEFVLPSEGGYDRRRDGVENDQSLLDRPYVPLVHFSYHGSARSHAHLPSENFSYKSADPSNKRSKRGATPPYRLNDAPFETETGAGAGSAAVEPGTDLEPDGRR